MLKWPRIVRPRVVERRLSVNALPKLTANYEALSPLNWLERAARVYADAPAVVQIDGSIQTWTELRNRSVKLSSVLAERGIGRGDVVQVMLDNTAEMLESHYGIPMSGATLGCINTRLDAKSIAFILQHSEAKGLIYDERFEPVVHEALESLKDPLRFVVKVDVGNSTNSTKNL